VLDQAALPHVSDTKLTTIDGTGMGIDGRHISASSFAFFRLQRSHHPSGHGIWKAERQIKENNGEEGRETV